MMNMILSFMAQVPRLIMLLFILVLSGCGPGFLDASSRGDIDTVRDKIKNSSQDVDVNEALCLASRGGHIDIVRLLVEKGADPNYNEWSWTPLALAAYNNHFEIVKLLVDKGSDVNAASKEKAYIIKDKKIVEQGGYYYYQVESVAKGCTPIFDAIKQKNYQMVSFLLKHKANPNIRCIWEGADTGSEAAPGLSFTKAIAFEGRPVIIVKIDSDIHGNIRANVMPRRFHKEMTPLRLSNTLNLKEISKLLMDYGAIDEGK
jgi:ankyrin repeat protein